MHLFKKIFIAVFIVATLGACNSLFKNNDEKIDFNLQTSKTQEQATTFNGDSLVFIPIDYQDAPPEKYDYPEFTSSVENKQIVINGYYLASSGFIPEGSIDEDDKTITILIKHPEDNNTAPSEPQGFFYDVNIRNLSDGNYRVKMIHRNDLMRGKFGNKDTVFSKEFNVK